MEAANLSGIFDNDRDVYLCLSSFFSPLLRIRLNPPSSDLRRNVSRANPLLDNSFRIFDNSGVLSSRRVIPAGIARQALILLG